MMCENENKGEKKDGDKVPLVKIVNEDEWNAVKGQVYAKFAFAVQEAFYPEGRMVIDEKFHVRILEHCILQLMLTGGCFDYRFKIGVCQDAILQFHEEMVGIPSNKSTDTN